jgi:hypothetical protein
MDTSRTTALSKPVAGKKVPLGTLAYFRARAKRGAYDLVIKEFKKSGITQAELARRLGKGTDRICKVLGGPGNWTLDTVSDLLFAISGAVPAYGTSYPLDKAARNNTAPEWLTAPDWVKRIQAPPSQPAPPSKQPPVACPPGAPIDEKKATVLPKELVS